MRDPVLSPLAQIEWTLDDLAGAQELLGSLFGVQTIEEEFSRVLCGPHMDIVHLGLGEVVLQLCRPLLDITGHWSALERWGPHVYNLTWFVDDLANLLERCSAAGFEAEWHYPLGDLYRRLLGEELLAGSLEAAMISSRSLLGFDLELAETPWAREPVPRIVYPAYHSDWPQRGELVGRLALINIVTPDLEASLGALQAVFGRAARMRYPPAHNREQGVREALVELGRAPLHYIEPESGDPRFAERLESIGASVHSLALPARQPDELGRRAADRGISLVEGPRFLCEPGDGAGDGVRVLELGDTFGIDIVLA